MWDIGVKRVEMQSCRALIPEYVVQITWGPKCLLHNTGDRDSITKKTCASKFQDLQSVRAL